MKLIAGTKSVSWSLDAISVCCQIGETLDHREAGFEEFRNFMQHNDGENRVVFRVNIQT